MNAGRAAPESAPIPEGQLQSAVEAVRMRQCQALQMRKVGRKVIRHAGSCNYLFPPG
jgi:hypothetical protein